MGTPFLIIIALALIIGIVVWSIKRKKGGTKSVEVVSINTGQDGSRPSVKKALIVGINIYKPELGANLRGCVNDAKSMREALVNVYKFDPDNVRVLTDERATKAAIIERLQWLIDGCISGDELVFHYSGHGSQVRDRHGDELDDDMDEILCPHDLNWDDPLTDDFLGDMFSKIPVGVHFTVICDACHSGTMTKALLGSASPQDIVARFILPPYDIRSRSLGQKLSKNRLRKSMLYGPQNHVLLSGCKDDQTSADAFIDNKYQGALTWALTSAIKDNPTMTWKEAHDTVVNKLKSGFTQEPQLSGDDILLSRKIFGG